MLLKIIKNIFKLQAYSLGLFRSDYMAHTYEGNAIKQVEINTVASSFGGISTHMKPLQRYSIQF